jgi:hypothetical protein
MRTAIVFTMIAGLFAAGCSIPMADYRMKSPTNRASTLSTLTGPDSKYPDRRTEPWAETASSESQPRTKDKGKRSRVGDIALGAGIGVAVATLAVVGLGYLLISSIPDPEPIGCWLPGCGGEDDGTWH